MNFKFWNMDESDYNISDEEMASLAKAIDSMLDEEEPDFDAELIEAGWNIVHENPGIECQEWINELIRQYPTEVIDALGNNPPEVFLTLADWWEYKEYTDPSTGEWNTLKGWSEFYATDVDCLQERLETANKRIKELEMELSEAKAEIRRLEAQHSQKMIEHPAEAAKPKERAENSQYGDISWLQEKIALLEQQILDKETIICDKERIIGLLSK